MPADELLNRTWLGVRFKSGLTPLGHHWEILDDREQVVGGTRRTYGAKAGKVLGRLVTVTGMDSGNAIRAEVFGAGGEVLARLHSKAAKEPVVEFETADAALVGRTRRTGQVVRFEEGPGHVEVGCIQSGEQDPWPVLDAEGQQIGAMSRVKAERARGGSLTELILFPDLFAIDQRAQDSQNTMHFGFARSRQYWIVLDPERPLTPSLKTFAALAPILAAYSY